VVIKSVNLNLIYFFILQVIVVHVGTNNVEHTPEQVCEGILEIIRIIREKHPSAYIVLPVSNNMLILDY
jgi:hypothetical protein